MSMKAKLGAPTKAPFQPGAPARSPSEPTNDKPSAPTK